jgi:hypothetical protein
LRHASVSLLWFDRSAGAAKVNSRLLEPIQDMSGVLDRFYRESVESPSVLNPGEGAFPEGISVSQVIRFFPEKICAPLKIVRINAASGATLESLLAARSQIIQVLGGTAPVLGMAKLALLNHCSNAARTERLISELGGGDLHRLDASGESDPLFYNRHAIIVRQGQAAAAPKDPDLELEMLVYLAFLKQSLSAFSERIDNLLPGEERPLNLLEAQSLQRDFLRFRARYNRLNPADAEGGGMVLSALASLFSSDNQFVEVQSQLDQLKQLKHQSDIRGRAKAEKLIQLALYFVAAAVVLQTALALFSWLRR